MAETAQQAGLGNIRDRVIELRRVPANQLRPHPKNAREHPESQKQAMRDVLNNLGFAGAALAVERNGTLLTCDGHLRSETMGDKPIPVLLLDLNDQEVETLLLTYDPIAAMAVTNTKKAEALAEGVKKSAAGLKDTIDAVMANLGAQASAAMNAAQDAKLVVINTTKPPAMAWVLIGISTIRYGEISSDMERLSEIPGVTVETAVNNG